MVAEMEEPRDETQEAEEQMRAQQEENPSEGEDHMEE